MKSEPAEAQWLLDEAEISSGEPSQVSGLSAELLRELVDDGALDPLNMKAASDARTPQWNFSPMHSRRACRLSPA